MSLVTSIGPSISLPPQTYSMLLPGMNAGVVSNWIQGPSRAALFRAAVSRWRAEAPDAQKETLDRLVVTLNENRPDQRRIFR